MAAALNKCALVLTKHLKTAYSLSELGRVHGPPPCIKIHNKLSYHPVVAPKKRHAGLRSMETTLGDKFFGQDKEINLEHFRKT